MTNGTGVTYGTQRSWTDEEHGFLLDHKEMTAEQIAAALDRTVASVRVKRWKMRNGQVPQADKGASWTPHEDALILASPHLRAREIADLLDRSRQSVATRRRVLRKAGHEVTVDLPPDPNRIGARPLLAKTCRACGLLLQAKWFRLNRKAGVWTSDCGRCRDRSGETQNTSERARAQRSAFVEKMQALTMQHAKRGGQPWTGVDDQVLSDPDLTILEKALRTSRTYKAVNVQCSRRGYRSLVGLGDPYKDQWFIDNPSAPAAA